MKLERAIEIQTNLKAATNTASRQDCEKAYQLGIEALKMIKHYRTLRGIENLLPLPGETTQ